MVALVHVPGLYSIIFWKNLLDNPKCAAWELIRRTQEYPDTEASLIFLCRCLAPFLFPAQVAVVCLVWAGYAWPTELYLVEEPQDMEAQFHAKSMWIVIPPVVANVVANAAYFAFFSYSHYLQIDQELDDLTYGDRSSLYPEIESRGQCVRLSQDTTILGEIEAEMQMDEVFYHFFRVQDELDDSCKQWSPLVATFLMWALGAMIAVTFDLMEYLAKTDLAQFTIWVCLIDLFLAVSSLLFIFGFLIMGAILTERMDDFCIDMVQVMRTKRVPVSKAAASFSYLQTGGRKSGLGFKIFNKRIDWAVVGTCLSIVVTGLGLVLATVQPGGGGDAMRLNPVKHR